MDRLSYNPKQENRRSPHFPLRGMLICCALLGILFAFQPIYAQQQPTNTTAKSVSGVVKDASGEPLIGATIQQKGTANKTITDTNGRFTLNVPPGAPLVISYIGLHEQELKATPNMEIMLGDDVNALDEVVVVGYGTVKKADLAGSVSVLDSKAFKDQPLTRIDDALQGRIAGVHVVSSGIPGGDMKIRIRGAGSINRSNDPLYVVDGIVRESGLTGLDPEDIQSIQVLKDASATAIYGSRGSNGVVLVTMKSGKADVKQISFDAQFGFADMAKHYSLLDAYEFATAYNEAHPGTFNQTDLTAFQNGEKGTNWQKAISQTGFIQNYKVTLTNGNKDTQYYLSGNYLGQTGAVKRSKNERYQVKLNLTSNIAKWLNITADINASHNVRNTVNFGASKNNILWVALNYSPVTNIMDENGKYCRDFYNAITADNPVGTLNINGGQYRKDIFNGRIDLRFNILPGLSFTTTNGVDYNDTKYYSFSSKRVSEQSRLSNRDGQRMTLQSTNNLTYIGQWGQHSLTATGVFEATQSEYRMMGISGEGLLTESVGWWNIGLAKTKTESNGYESWALLSGVGRLMYNYDNRYLLTTTFRADGSSKFFKNKWGYFPSIALAWSLGNEKFMQKQDIIQDAKLRLSYGLVGSQAISPYETLGLMKQEGYAFGGTTKYTGFWTGTSRATPDLTWEKTHQFNVGLDFSTLAHRLRFSIDYFKKITKDGLLKKTLPQYDGGGDYWVNACEVVNSGVDFNIDATLLSQKDFSWNTSLTGTYLKNKVTSLDNIPFVQGQSPSTGLIGDVTRVVVGQPIGAFYLYQWTGLDATGHDTYADLDGSGTVSEGDRTFCGKANPTFTFGWNNRVSWRHWDLNLFFTAAFGAKRLNLMRYFAASMNGASKFITLKDAYYQSFGKTDSPMFPAVTVTNNYYQGASTKWLEKADYFRLDNITLSYCFTKQQTRFTDIHLSLSCQNVFTITGYKGLDPSGISFMDSSQGSIDVNDGIDMGAYPLTRTFTLGIKMNF
ncbi:SusC/RagA family TonB-linked outer membrane protein [Segatella maculosa]|uniref:SusC/RagA family TonB-linked outer membrane protein n=1 Tax=Segatella maculosa TaxID=439703 RepID=UPI00046F4E8C